MRLLPFARARREPAPDSLIRLFQSETGEIQEAPEPVQARVTVWALIVCFSSLIGVALLVPIDRVVQSSTGTIVTTEPPTVLQALDTSIIKTIDVQEGERVSPGQLLATLDPTFAAADVGSLRMQIASLEAEIARCQAELARKDSFNPADNGMPEMGLYAALQKSYFVQRKAQFDAQLHAFDEQIAKLKTTVAKFQNDQIRFADRAKISKEIEDMRATLAANQVGSRLNLLVATDQRLEILRNLELDNGQLVENEHQLESVVAHREAFVQQWLGQISQELVTARNNRDKAVEDLAKAEKHQALVRLEAPDDAVVLKLTKLSVGSVLKQGDPLITLAPLKAPVEAEVHINARDVGFLRPGDPVRIKLSAFNYAEHGTAEGVVRWISEGSFTSNDDSNSKPEPPFYLARIAFTKVVLRNVPDSFRLMPGMTLTADISVGTRSAFMFLFGGFAGLSEAMREP
jgi:hemolysin D